ncbi:porin [Pseudomaricurvus sp. HS19]|uniref:porin n=1 Tax=Pseudomaricurvus sp. HS19 TaxID=2692626 RepID=UPI00136B80E5|nr:porin [Pseudomaricurvus sp. HS19]MYM63249.1 porin [Pseudomaricurvus sp. HS19]
MWKKSVLAVAVGAASLAAQAQQTPSMEEMWQLIQQQQAEIKELKSQLNKTDNKLQVTEQKLDATADAVEQGVAVGSNEKLAKLASWAEKTSIGGYGEHHFNHKEDGDDQIDAHRYVLYIGHQFTDKVRFFSEFELEHSLAGDGKPGEVELEQAYIEYDFAEKHSVQIGQFLMPVGILNETHEPDTFYGTERNKVEAEVIPATWWEAGVMALGEIAPGLSYNAAVHSGLKTDNFRIRSGRQKNAEATAEDLAFTGRLKYTGIQGLELAATYQYQQDIAQGLLTESAEASLMEAHAIYNIGGFGVRALWAEWDIDGADFEAAEADTQSGWYLEPSYKFTDKLGVFVRYSEWDRGDKMLSDIDYKAYDYGINYWIHPQVVLKADYTDTVGKNDEGDALNLGVGWSF